MNPERETRTLLPCPDCERRCSPAARACPNCGRPLAEASLDDAPLHDKMIDQIMLHSSLKTGMCLTLLGLIKVVEGVKRTSVFSDEALAVTAFGFLLASIVSYLALKDRNIERRRRKVKISDLLFSIALGLLAVVCGVVAIEMF
ncbi:MAG: hypothetical protein HY231_15275 [Acidobacteria bacterium]|nr:hypothetical protein [Acidobacteriota bacterium]